MTICEQTLVMDEWLKDSCIPQVIRNTKFCWLELLWSSYGPCNIIVSILRNAICTKLLWCFILKILVCAIMLGFHKSSRDTAKNSQNKIKIKLKMKLNHYNKTLRPEKHEGDQLYHWYWPTAPMQVWSTEMNIDCFNNGKGQAHLNPR